MVILCTPPQQFRILTGQGKNFKLYCEIFDIEIYFERDFFRCYVEIMYQIDTKVNDDLKIE